MSNSESSRDMLYRLEEHYKSNIQYGSVCIVKIDNEYYAMNTRGKGVDEDRYDAWQLNADLKVFNEIEVVSKFVIDDNEDIIGIEYNKVG